MSIPGQIFLNRLYRHRDTTDCLFTSTVSFYYQPGPESLADIMESSTTQDETTATTALPSTAITSTQSPSTAKPDAGEETSSTGNATTIDGGGDHNASTSGSVINETTVTSSPGNNGSENATMVTDQSSDVTTSDGGKDGEDSTVLTFRPSQEGGDSQGEASSTDAVGTAKTDNNPGVGHVRNHQPRTAATASTSTEILPIVIGILAALVIVAIFVAVVVWAVARRKQKRDAEIEDELKIISRSSESK